MGFHLVFVMPVHGSSSVSNKGSAINRLIFVGLWALWMNLWVCVRVMMFLDGLT